MMPAASVAHTPAHHTSRGDPSRGAIALLIGGPLAWFVQLNVGVSLLSSVCFDDSMRLPELPSRLGWAPLVAAIVTVVCALLAGFTALAAWRTLRQPARALPDAAEAREVGRVRFMALWGVILGAGAAIASLVNLVALLWVAPCRG